MNITLFDYGVGNIHSLKKALEAGGADVRVEPDADHALDGDALVLPGVGAFGAAAERLDPARAAIRDALADGFPCLGVCLGMQLLFERSEESDGRGVGALPGHVRRLRARRVPHMGWNELIPVANAANAAPPGTEPQPEPQPEPGPVRSRAVVYYANSYAAAPSDEADVVAWTEYDGDRFPAIVRRGRTWGMQFHPEKSGAAGLALIREFLGDAAR